MLSFVSNTKPRITCQIICTINSGRVFFSQPVGVVRTRRKCGCGDYYNIMIYRIAFGFLRFKRFPSVRRNESFNLMRRQISSLIHRSSVIDACKRRRHVRIVECAIVIGHFHWPQGRLGALRQLQYLLRFPGGMPKTHRTPEHRVHARCKCERIYAHGLHNICPHTWNNTHNNGRRRDNRSGETCARDVMRYTSIIRYIFFRFYF